MGNTAFQSCSRLVSVTIPESVTSIGDYAFEKCPSLTSIVVENGNPVYDSRGNCNAIIKTATNTLVSGCKNTVIPNSVTSIGDHAFMNCSGLTSVTIPNSVTSIGEYAFDQCGLTSVTIPNSVTSIDKYSFSRCHNLTEIHWTPNANTNLSSRLSNADLTSTIRTLYLYKNSDNAAMVDQLVSDLEGQFKEIIVVCPLELAAYLAEDGSGDYYCTYYNEDDSYAVGDNLAEAYTATVSGSTVTLTPIEGGVILAGTPVILRSTQETIPLNYAGSNTTATYGQNDLLGTAESLAVSKSGNIYVMRNGKFYIAVGGTIPANRAYLQLNASAGAPSRLDMVIGEATALQRVQDETEAEVWYTLSGVRVEHPTKAGIYIKNGMKVLVK
ncbi:MAG: leucine-rich repeat domain-containing protein [Bacteroidaceae bacterium]|nr:leucine-rich repeat domain-containing protein [Bacteroidaceae bacterium]